MQKTVRNFGKFLRLAKNAHSGEIWAGRIGGFPPGGTKTLCTLSDSESSTDCVVIGAGVVGLAIARALSLRGRDVLVLDEGQSIGTSTSSRNSEVIHAGLYYKSNSLKAMLCVEGKHMLYEYCETKNIPYKKLGKLIVATNPRQMSTLRMIAQQAKRNKVDDVEEVDKMTAGILEPELSCVGALLSPSTGIIDSHSYMTSLQQDAESNGAMFSFGSKVVGGSMEALPKELIVQDVESGEKTSITAECIVNATGLNAWEVARSFTGYSTQYLPNQYYAKGCYFSLQGRVPFTRLIYPIPEPGGLGVHLTLDLSGRAKFGPDVEWVDELDYSVDPERALRFYPAIREYYPGLPKGSLSPDYAGIRPKVVGSHEDPADFVIQNHSKHIVLGLVNLFGIESPGLTSSLAIAEYVAEMLE